MTITKLTHGGRTYHFDSPLEAKVAGQPNGLKSVYVGNGNEWVWGDGWTPDAAMTDLAENFDIAYRDIAEAADDDLCPERLGGSSAPELKAWLLSVVARIEENES